MAAVEASSGKESQVDPFIAGRTADVVLTSPPYRYRSFVEDPPLKRAALHQRLEAQASVAVRHFLGDHVIVLDIEPQGSRIIELGMVRLTFGHVEAVESLLFDPGLEVLGPASGGKAKQAKAALVAGAGSFREQMAHVHNFVAGHRKFVGWNRANDRTNFANELQLAGSPAGEVTWVDGLDLLRVAYDRDGRYSPGLEAAYNEVFGTTWKQGSSHYALDDALHTAHLVRAACRLLVERGKRPEQVPTVPGFLGTGWQPIDVISMPKRRYELPPQPGNPPGTSPMRGWFERVDRWRTAEGLAPRTPDPDPCPAWSRQRRLAQVQDQPEPPSEVRHWQARRRQRWQDSGLTTRYELPLPAELHQLRHQLEARTQRGGGEDVAATTSPRPASLSLP